MVLVNGSEGIGTGWSSSVPTYNPRDIVANLRRLMAGEELQAMQPWFRGFKVRGQKRKEEQRRMKLNALIAHCGGTLPCSLSSMLASLYSEAVSAYLEVWSAYRLTLS